MALKCWQSLLYFCNVLAQLPSLLIIRCPSGCGGTGWCSYPQGLTTRQAMQGIVRSVHSGEKVPAQRACSEPVPVRCAGKLLFFYKHRFCHVGCQFKYQIAWKNYCLFSAHFPYFYTLFFTGGRGLREPGAPVAARDPGNGLCQHGQQPRQLHEQPLLQIARH